MTLKYPNAFRLIRSELDFIEALKWRIMNVKVYWGPTGTGKTRKAMDHESVYKLDMANSLWFNGYNRQKRLVVDDFYGWIKYGHLF